MGKAEDERLQRYFDGELPEAERAEMERMLTEDDQLKLAALAEVRGLVANALRAEAGEVDLWAGIDAKLRPQGAARAGGPTPRRRWAGRAGWSAGLMALVAAALLVVFRPWHPAHAQNGCEIESLDTYGAVATVINIDDAPHHGDEPTTVIFTMEDD